MSFVSNHRVLEERKKALIAVCLFVTFAAPTCLASAAYFDWQSCIPRCRSQACCQADLGGMMQPVWRVMDTGSPPSNGTDAVGLKSASITKVTYAGDPRRGCGGACIVPCTVYGSGKGKECFEGHNGTCTGGPHVGIGYGERVEMEVEIGCKAGYRAIEGAQAGGAGSGGRSAVVAGTCTMEGGTGMRMDVAGAEEGGKTLKCADIDECAEGRDLCDANASCSNTIGSYSCICNAGYVGDGRSCYAHGVGRLASPSSRSWSMCTVGEAAKCWGSNVFGQLARNASAELSTHTPGRVQGLAGGNHSISVGEEFVCVLTEEGGVYCWGSFFNGRLGSKTVHDLLRHRSTPSLSVTGLDGSTADSRATHLSSGTFAACAVKVSGAVVCWGHSAQGATGTGSLTDNFDPKVVVGLDASGGSTGRRASSVECGLNYCCAVILNGTMQCWGTNLHGQLGDGTAGNERHTPVRVAYFDGLAPASSASSVAVHFAHSCAVSGTGAVWCWGAGNNGRLGHGTQGSSSVPVGVSNIDGSADVKRAKAVVVTDFSSCAVMLSGSVSCWGHGGAGLLGINQYIDTLIPVSLPSLNGASPSSTVLQLNAGKHHICGVTADGSVRCWGNNYLGRAGHHFPSTGDITAPTAINAGGQYSSVSSSVFSSCAMRKGSSSAESHVVCFGSDRYGILGRGRPVSVDSPGAIQGLPAGSHVQKLALSANTICLVTSNGSVMCAGGEGLLVGNTVGLGTAALTVIPGMEGSTDSTKALLVVLGFGHACAIMQQTRAAKCWGYDNNGRLGDASGEQASQYPLQVHGLDGSGGPGTRAAGISAGDCSTCALTESGSVQCWGCGGHGNLGNGNSVDQHTPVTVVGLNGGSSEGSRARKVSVGCWHACAIVATGGVRCWGAGWQGRLGNGGTASSSIPVDVLGLDGSQPGREAVELSLGCHTSCAVLRTGGVVCWGNGYEGALGNGVRQESSVPVAVTGFDGMDANRTAVEMYSAEFMHCVVSAGGSLYCWGLQRDGLFGDRSPRADLLSPMKMPTGFYEA